MRFSVTTEVSRFFTEKKIENIPEKVVPNGFYHEDIDETELDAF